MMSKIYSKPLSILSNIKAQAQPCRILLTAANPNKDGNLVVRLTLLEAAPKGFDSKVPPDDRDTYGRLSPGVTVSPASDFWQLPP